MQSLVWKRKKDKKQRRKKPKLRTTTNSCTLYCEMLKKLGQAIQNKRRSKLTKFVFLIHDNALPHTAQMSQDLLEQFLRDVSIQLPNYPSLALSDFHLYPHFKQHLGRRHFENEDDLKIKAERWQTKVPNVYKTSWK